MRWDSKTNAFLNHKVIEGRKKDHGEMEPSSNKPVSNVGATQMVCDNMPEYTEPEPQTKSKPFMDFRNSQVEALWAWVSNTKRLHDRMNDSPTVFKAFLKMRHKFRDDQFFYMLDMIRDRQDQEMGR